MIKKLKHKLTIYRHYKSAYSDEKESERGEREREGNEEKQSKKIIKIIIK